MIQTFLLFDTITNENTVKFMQRDIITSTITWHLELVGSNNFGEYTSFRKYTAAIRCRNILPQSPLWFGLGVQNSANVSPCACRKRRLTKGYKLSYTTGLLHAWHSCMQ